MTTITPEEIVQFRSQLASYPEMIAALDKVEACDNSLEDAAQELAIQAGYTRSRLAPPGLSYLDKLTEQARDIICSKYTDDVLELFNELRTYTPFPTFPTSLVALVAIKVAQIGIREFCESSK